MNIKSEKLIKWVLKMVSRALVRQGINHRSNIVEYYKIMNDAAREEFTEDSRKSLNIYLEDAFKDSLK